MRTSQRDIKAIAAALVQTYQSSDFDHGVMLLARALHNEYGCGSSKSDREVLAATRGLLAILNGDAAQGVLALAGAIVRDVSDLERVANEAERLRALLPEPDIEGSLVRDWQQAMGAK